jgi:hypothetical protein
METKIFRFITAKSLKSWEKIVSKFLSETSRVYSYLPPSDASTIQIEKNLLESFQKNHHYFSASRPLVGHVTKKIEDIELTQKLLIDAYQVFSDPFILEQVTGEILAKVLAYRSLKKGMILYIPWVIGTKTDLIPFEVDRVFDLWKSMHAFGLRPIDKRHASLLLFRGTDLSLLSRSSRISIMSNFDPKGPGYSIFLHAKKRIHEWMMTTTKQNHKVKAIGYSLGGALASYLLFSEPEFFSETSCSLLFNQPGLLNENIEKFMKAQELHQFKVRSYIAEGDPVSKFGSLFCETIGLRIPQLVLPPFEAHTQLFSALSNFEARRVNIEIENQSESRKFYSNLHSKTSRVLYKLGIKHFLP